MIEGRVVMALIDALWQGAVVALAAAGILRIVRTNAATRYAVWSAVLVVLAVLPFANLISVAPRIGQAIVPLVSRAVVPHFSNALTADAAKAGTLKANVAPRPHAVPAPAQPVQDEAMPASRHPLVFHVTRTSIRLILGLLVAVAFLRVFALLRSYLRLRGIVRRAVPLERALPVAIARPVKLATSEAVAVPVAVGLGDATIILPSKVLAELSDEDLDQVLLHEAAHLARRDDFTNLLARAVAAMLFFHPAVHAVARRLDLEREIACDDWVIASTGRRRPYAFCLTKLAELVRICAARTLTARPFTSSGSAARDSEGRRSPERAFRAAPAAAPTSRVDGSTA